MSSQPQLYDFLEERYPELFERICDRVKEKRWEPEGGMWVEADCNLTSGESLVRQFMYGKKYFKDKFNIDNKILWLPDVFGYSGALPQIMKKSGIDYFMTTKLAWNQYNKIPNDTMYWKGIDGSKIFTHLITTLGVGQPSSDFFTTYNGMLHPDSIMGGWERYQNKDINNDILVSYGYGDGGGGPTREMLEASKRMKKGVKGIPKVRQEFARTYFEELEEKVKNHKRLPEWEGELYFEYHRGTYTSMARNKRSNRKLEIGLMNVELFQTMVDEKDKYSKEKLDTLWKMMLLNQFHDILPGTSIKEVYDVTKEEYAYIENEINLILKQHMELMSEESQSHITVFNTLGHKRNDVLILDGHMDIGTAIALKDKERYYPIQATTEGYVTYVEDIPSKGYKTFELVSVLEEVEKMNPFILNGEFVLETPFYHIRLNENGLFTSIYDLENERELILEGEVANIMRVYEDKPIYYDNWDIDVFYQEKFWDVTEVKTMSWTEIGPVRATLTIERPFSKSTIIQKIYFYANHRRIDFQTYVDWKEYQHLLKVHFPVDIHTDEATFDIQFGNVTRKTHLNTSWDQARFESCGQKWMDRSEGYYGVSLMNDCKYGHSVKDSSMALTLIKSGIEPNKTTDQEEHYFTYALFPHKEDWRRGGTIKAAYELNFPLLSSMGKMETLESGMISVDCENVVIETVKPAENNLGIIVRMYEAMKAKSKVKVSVNLHWKHCYLCNLMEEAEKELDIVDGQVELMIKPFEIITLRFCE